MYNGHKNYNAWNVSLWINNDEHLYNLAKWCINISKNKEIAARNMIDELRKRGIANTSDGVKFTKTNVRLAMNGM
jgi:hypothetical protein